MDYRQNFLDGLLDSGEQIHRNASLAAQLGNAPTESDRQFLLNYAERTGQIAPRKDGAWTEFWQGAGYGGQNVIRGLASTAEELGFGSGMRQRADDWMQRNQQLRPYEGYSGLSLNPTDIARTVGTGAAQSIGSMAVGAGTTIATGNPVAGTAAMTAFMFGQIYGDRVKEYRDIMQGVPEGQVKALALVSSIGESLIESYIGPEQAVVRLFGKNAGEKAVGAAVRSLVRKAGKDEALKILGGGQATAELAKIIGKDVSDQVLGKAVKKLGQSGLERLAAEAAKDFAHDAAKKSMAALLANAVKTVGKEAAIGYLTEGSEEVSQMYWNELVKAMGTHHIELPAWEEVAEEFSGGAWTGLFMGGGQQMLSSFMDRAADRRYAAGDVRQMGEGETVPEDAKPVEGDEAAASPALSPEEQAARDARRSMAEKVATMSGMDVVWLTPEQIEAERQRRAERLEANGQATEEAANAPVGGWYHYDRERGKGTAYINPEDTRGVDFVIGHELYHDMMDSEHGKSTGIGQAVRRVIREAVRGKDKESLNPAAQKLYERIQNLYTEYKAGSEDFNQEFEADIWGHLFTDNEFMTDLGAELERRQQGLGVKFIEAIRDFVGRIIDAIKGDESPESSRLLNEYEQTREALAKLAADYTETNVKAVNGALQSLHDVLYRSGPAARDAEEAQREADKQAGRERAKEIAVEREQERERRNAEMAADEEQFAREQEAANAEKRKAAEERGKAAREKEAAANKAELERLDKADAQEKKDMAANNREGAELAEEQERLRKGGREAKKMRGRTKNYQNARKKAAAVPNMTHPDGSKVPEGTIYAVVDAAKGGDIVTSYDGEGYDQALQNSDTGTQATELIGRHSDNPNAALMLGSDSTSQGIPVVDPDTGDVVIHNTGVMIRRAMAEKGTDKEYNEKLAAEAKRLKVPFPDDARIPMLVAYLPEGMSRDAKIEQAKKGNLTTTRSVDAGQRAAADATVFATDDGQKVLSMLPDADSDRLVSEANSAFVKAAYAMLAKEDGDLVDGRPTDKFNDRLENAMMSLLFSGLKEEERTRRAGDLVNDARNLGLADFKSALAVKAAKLNLIALRNKDFDLRPELSKATRDIVKWKRSGMKFAGDYANQLNFDPKDNMPEADKPLFLALGNASQVSAKAVRQVLDAYIDGARAELQGQTLIGDKVTKATLVQRMADASAEIISSRKYSLSAAELKSAAKQDGIDLDKETQEFRDIYARYRDTKQWMKAPNGKDSKLTARQWVQVRTPSFKKWAGDWEAASIRKNLGWTDVVDVNAVRSLPSQNITGIKPVADKAALMELFRSFGEVRNESDGTKVRFPTKSAGKMIFKKNYASAFKSLFESSIHAFTEKETQFDGHKYHPNITSYRHYVNKFSDEEGTHYIRFTVRDDNNGTLVHNAEISDIEIYDESDATQFGNQTDGKRRFKDNKLALFFTDVKSTTKIVDENGEPMVMWHQTNNEFTEFNVRHRGKGTSDEQMPFGIFMKYTPNKIWEGGKQMALYANIQRPVQFENREQMADWLRKNVKSYGQLETEYRQAEDEFKHRYDNAQKRQLEEIAKLRQDGAKRSESYNATRAIVQTVLDEWADYESNSPLIAKMKEAINGHLEKIGIDGVIVDQDTGSYGRSVKTCIAMSSNQVKSATDNVGTFSNENPDIRYSLTESQRKGAEDLDIDLDKETQEFRDVFARYHGTRQWLKAPNGSRTNLSARQWVQVRTPAFKQWFGDWENETQNNSKVVDENGEPKIVYHGTVNGAFTVFDKDRIGERWNADEIGFFFTSDEAIGIDYTIPYGSKEGKPHLFNVYLNIKKPLMINSKWFRENYNRSISRYDAIEIWDDNQADILDAFNQGEYDGIVINPTGMGMPQPKMYIAMESNQIKSATDNVGTFSEENPDIRYSLVTDEKINDEFKDDGKTIVTYRSALLGDDGRLYPPMATRGGEGMELGKAYKSDEHPELRNKKGKFPLKSAMRDSGAKGEVPAAYNPYFHSQPGVLNDQFSVAYDKSRMVTVRCRVLKSDIESGYQAEGAKDPVGFAEWATSGPVTRQMRGRGGRSVILSRYIMPVEIVPDVEVARMIKDYIGGQDVTVPWNVVPPNLRDELVKNGVKVGSEEDFRQAEQKRTRRYSLIGKKEDDAYMAAARKGDMAAAQKMVDKAAAAAGYTIKAYHGTPNGTFTVFRGWQYFTKNKSYADIYQNQGASSNGYKPTAENPRTYDVYLKTDKPFDTRNETERKIFEDEFLGKWGNGTPLSERSLPDWTDGDDLVEFFKENGYDYDAIYLDEGATGGYGYEVKDRGVAIVIKNPEQIKSADPITRDDNGTIIPLSRRFDENEPDIRYSLISKEEDAAYMAAVERGDMETAQKMVDDAAERNGYSADDSWRMQHRAPNRESGDPNLENIKDSDLVPDDYWDHPEWYQSSDMEREAFWTVRKHIARAEEKKAKGDNSPTFMKVYRAVSKSSNKREERVRNGDWVTPLKAYAIQEGRMNPEGYRIIQTSARLQDLYWDGNSIAEMGYDDGQNYAYKDTANNRKLLDAVTYDDDGNVIPLSKRFNKRDIRTRYSLRRNQSNPIVSDGKVRADYQDLLDNGRYTPEHVAEWEAGAVQWIRKVGGVENAVGLIVDGLEPSGKIGTMAVRLVMESDTFKALPQDKQLDVEMRNIMQGTEWGREGFARRVASMTLDSAAKVRRVIDAFRSKLTPKERDKMREDVLRDTGIDLDSIPDDIHRDREKLDSLITAALASKAATKDKLYEYWVNAILSAPLTHVANTVGNLANFAYELGVKRLAEATVNHFAKRPDAARFSDFRAMWASVDWKNAWRSAVQAFNIEVLDASGKYVEGAAPAIEGKKGRIIRIPGRFLRAADEFAKAIIVPIETAAMADRLGRQQNLVGAELDAFIKRQLRDADSEAAAYGRRRSLELTFQEDPGKIVTTLVALKNGDSRWATIVKYLFPFMKTPYNLLRQGIRKSPLGTLSLLDEGIDILRGKRQADSDFIAHAAEQVVAWSLVGMALAMGGGDNDDEPPRLIGSSKGGAAGERMFRGQHVPAYSIRIGDKYYSYKRIEPLSTMLALIADGLDAYRQAKTDEGASKALRGMFGGTLRLIGEKSYLNTFSQIVQLFDEPERSIGSWATDFTASWVPNAVRQASNAFDDVRRDSSVHTSGPRWWRDQFHVTLSKAGVMRMVPKVDCFGRPITKDDAEKAGPGDILWRLLIPSNTKSADAMDPAEKTIWNWNIRNPDVQYWPGMANYRFSFDGAKYEMYGKDYSDFAMESGRLAHRRILELVNQGRIKPSRPTESDISMIKTIISGARKQTREKYVRQHRCDKMK